MLPFMHAFSWRPNHGATEPREADRDTHERDENARSENGPRAIGPTLAHDGTSAANAPLKKPQLPAPATTIAKVERPVTPKPKEKTFSLWIPEEGTFRKTLTALSVFDWERDKTPLRRSLFRQARINIPPARLPPQLLATPTIDVTAGLAPVVWHRTVNAMISTQNCDPLFTLSAAMVFYQRLLRRALDLAAPTSAQTLPDVALPLASPPTAPAAPVASANPAGTGPGAGSGPGANANSVSAGARAWSLQSPAVVTQLVLELPGGTAPRLAAAAAHGPGKLTAYFHYEAGATSAVLNMNSAHVASNGFCAGIVQLQQQQQQVQAAMTASGAAGGLAGAKDVDICMPRRVSLHSADGRNLMFMAASIIAMKMYDDLHLANRYMSHFYDLPLASVNACEVAALKLLGFSLKLPTAEHRLMRAQLVKHVELAAPLRYT